MFIDSDLEKLAVESRQRLVQEFADKYANLAEKARRIPQNEAESIAEKFQCPLQVATVAYVMNLEGLLFLSDAINLLTLELNRRATVNEGIPNIPGSILNFALNEGQWIEHIYSSFARHLELKTRELANLEHVLDEDNPPIEKTLPVWHERVKLAETYILPVIDTWLKEHIKATSEDALLAFMPALTKWKRSSVKGKLPNIQRGTQAIFRKIRTVLIEDTSESATIDLTVKRIDALLEQLEKPTNEMDVQALSHILLHVAPRLSGRGDRLKYVDRGAASTRGNKTEPDMSSPFDFLERDVRLGKRRTGKEREDYLDERIGRVVRVLRYQGISHLDCLEQCIREIMDRIHLDGVSIEEILEDNREALQDLASDERDEYIVQSINNFIIENVYGD